MHFISESWQNLFNGQTEKEFLEYANTRINKDILLLEKRIDLDTYTNENAKFLLNSLLAHISTSKDKTITGFKPRDGLMLPSVVLKRRIDGKNSGGEYDSTNDIIFLYLLSDDNTVDQETINLLTSPNYINYISHELKHCYRDRMNKGAGRSLKIQHHNNLDTNYVNDPEEFESLKGEIELQAWKDVYTQIKIMSLVKGGIITKSDLCNVIHDVLNTYRETKNFRLGEILNKMTQQNLRKTYKDTYEYCIKEFMKVKLNIETNGENNKLLNKINDRVNLNHWEKNHPNFKWSD